MKTSWIVTPLILLLLAVGSYGTYLYLQPPTLPPQLLYANGHIEGTPVNIRSEIAASVIETNLREGDTVQQGDLLVHLDDREVTASLKQTQARVEALRASREAVSEELDTWEHHLQTASKDLRRYKKLSEKKLTSPREVEQAENRVEEARGQIESRRARLRELEARIEAGRQEVKRLRIQVDKTTVNAPLSATVLEKVVEPGEVVREGSLIAILVNLRDLEMKVYVSENQLGKIRLGAPARVKVNAFPNQSFPARVQSVDQRAQFTPRDIHLPEERQRMVFGVTLELKNSDGMLKPGMPADAWILWKKGASWPDTLVVPGE